MNRVVINKATSRNLSCVRALISAFLVAAGGLSAQTEAELNIGTYAGLTISGEIGSVYSIEYTDGGGVGVCLPRLDLG